jgi:hypothetical protein
VQFDRVPICGISLYPWWDFFSRSPKKKKLPRKKIYANNNYLLQEKFQDRTYKDVENIGQIKNIVF